MARAGAAVVLALAVCCLLVSPAPARRPADLPPRALHLHAVVADREAAAEAEPLVRPKPADCADAAEAEKKATAVSVPEEEPRQQRYSSSLLCLVFRCGGDPARVSGALVARRSSEEPQALDEGTWPARPRGKAEAEDEDEDDRPYDTDRDSDCDSDDDSDSDSDDEGEEDGVLGWLRRLADRF
jgi:hypothetical protein